MNDQLLVLPPGSLSRHFLLWIGSLVLLGLPLGARGQSPRTFTANGKTIHTRAFNKQVERMMRELGVPGASLAIISDNQVVFSNAYGYKRLGEKEKVDENTIFEACSISKTYLAYLAHKLADEGRLDLDKPMYQYFEWEPLKHEPRYKQITPRMVLSHSSGIYDEQSEPGQPMQIVSTPGERFGYSGMGYNYLATVIWSILQNGVEEYMHEHVLDPLGLKRTFTSYKSDGSAPLNYASGHTGMTTPVEKWKNFGPIPSGGMHVNATDYARFLLAVFDKKHLSPDRIKDILRPTARLGTDSSWYYGAGFEVQYSPTDTIVFHGGFNRGFKGFVCYSVVSKSGVVLFTNGERGSAMIKALLQRTVGIRLNNSLNTFFSAGYPGPTGRLVRLYQKKGEEQLFRGIEKRMKTPDRLPEMALVELGSIFNLENKPDIARRVLADNVKLYPRSGVTYYMLGELDMMRQDYAAAAYHYNKAKEMNFYTFSVEPHLKICAEKLSGKASAAK